MRYAALGRARGNQHLGAGACDHVAAEPRLRDGSRADGVEAVEDETVDAAALGETEAGRRRAACRTAQRGVARLIDLSDRERRTAGRVAKRRP